MSAEGTAKSEGEDAGQPFPFTPKISVSSLTFAPPSLSCAVFILERLCYGSSFFMRLAGSNLHPRKADSWNQKPPRTIHQRRKEMHIKEMLSDIH